MNRCVILLIILFLSVLLISCEDRMANDAFVNVTFNISESHFDVITPSDRENDLKLDYNSELIEKDLNLKFKASDIYKYNAQVVIKYFSIKADNDTINVHFIRARKCSNNEVCLSTCPVAIIATYGIGKHYIQSIRVHEISDED